MRPILAVLNALRRVGKSATAPLPGSIPFGAGGMLSQEWLAPHLMRLPDLRSGKSAPRD